MLICQVLFFFWGVSLFVASSSAFRLSPSIKAWIEHAQAGTTLGLSELAELSTSEALRAFTRYFSGIAILLFALYAVAELRLGEQGRQVLALGSFAFAYSAASINAWSKRREAILDEFIATAKRDTRRFTKYFLFFSAALLFIAAFISALVGDATFSAFGPFVLFLFAVLISLVAAITMANAASLAFVFGPALLAVAYLWLCIYVARVALLVGKKALINFLVLYAIVGTLYLTVLGFPELRSSLGVPALCR